MQAKRKFVRWHLNLPAKIKIAGEPEFIDCTLKDISLKGMRIVLSKHKLQLDARLDLTLMLFGEYILNMEAWVIWHKAVDGHNIYGLYFTRIKDADKENIYQFLRRYSAAQVNQKWWEQSTAKEGGETMWDAKFEDRRTFERVPAELALRFLDLHSNREGEAMSRDVSAKGIGFFSDIELTTQTPLEIWLEIPGQAKFIYTRGKVAWSKKSGLNQYRTGVDLEAADLMEVVEIAKAS